MPSTDREAISSAAAHRDLLDRDDHAYLAPLFLGPSGENAALLESLLTTFLRDHVYWRRNFHPEDPPSIPVATQYREDFQSAASRLEQALFRLSADLKQSVPSFAPRYIGHMVSDPLLAGLLGQLITTLYNPNNIASEAAPVTLELEIEVGRQLATMLGMSPDTGGGPQPWGHITSGGTVANYEALWLLRAARLFPPALAAAVRQMRSKLPQGLLRAPLHGRPSLDELDPWSLLNFTTDQACDLYSSFVSALDELTPGLRRQLAARVAAERHEYLGPDFFARHESTLPVVIVPATAHYSWSKAMTVLGMGRSRLQRVPTDTHMRMDAAALEELLQKNLQERQVVLAVVGVLGTTEFGTIDPLHKIASLRTRFAARGLGFAFHVDAAWGGYLSTIFRKADGRLRARKDMRAHFQFFPSPSVYQAFRALAKVDTVTVDPHKLGYISYGAGAFVARDHRLTSFVGEKPPYVYDQAESEKHNVSSSQRLHELGDYILEGSKSGAAAAATWLTHTVVPLNNEHFGRLCRQTVRTTECLHQELLKLALQLAPFCQLSIPVLPDTNLICLAVNPAGNQNLKAANDFARRIYRHLAVDKGQPVQTRQFIGSYTAVRRSSLREESAAQLARAVGVDPATFVVEVEDPQRQADHLFLIRHTLMNPWLHHMAGNGQTYLDKYCQYLVSIIHRELDAAGNATSTDAGETRHSGNKSRPA